MLALDGTGSLALNQRIFGERMTGERFAVPRDAEVWQVTGKTFSRQSITGTDRRGNPISRRRCSEADSLRAEVLELLQMLPGSVLLVTYKAGHRALLARISRHTSTSRTSGRCAGSTATSTARPSWSWVASSPPNAIEALTRPFCASDPEPFIPDRPVRPSVPWPTHAQQGGANVAEVEVHPEPRCQAMLEQVREAEIAQAIDRVRPVFNRRRIIVLTDIRSGSHRRPRTEMG